MALLKIDDHAGRSPFLSLSGARRWVATFIATIASTYALDAIATVAGILLVASHILQGFDHVVLLLFLAGTYVLWGLGLRVNLQANWMLLEATGTSTNVLSKAAYDLVTARTRSEATQDRGGGRLCRHRAREGGAILCRRFRPRPSHQLGVRERSHSLPGGSKPRRRRL